MKKILVIFCISSFAPKDGNLAGNLFLTNNQNSIGHGNEAYFSLPPIVQFQPKPSKSSLKPREILETLPKIETDTKKNQPKNPLKTAQFENFTENFKFMLKIFAIVSVMLAMLNFQFNLMKIFFEHETINVPKDPNFPMGKAVQIFHPNLAQKILKFFSNPMKFFR